MWFLIFAFNGLTVLSYEPFGSEEACVLAAKEANIATYQCLTAPEPGEQSE